MSDNYFLSRYHSAPTPVISDPAGVFAAPQAGATLGNTHATTQRTVVQTAGDQIDNQVKGATAPFTIEKSRADAAAAVAAAAKAQQERDALAQASRIKAASLALGNDEELAAINRARGLTSNWSTGFLGKQLKGWGGTQADNLAAQINTIAAGTTLGKLGDLKAQSATGASGLGQLSNREGDLLRDSVASLDQTQSKDQLLAGLNNVEQHYRKTRAIQSGADIHHPATWQQFGIQAGLKATDAQRAVQGAYADFQRQTANLPPQARQIGEQKFWANPDIRALQSAARGAEAGAHPSDIQAIMQKYGVR